MHLAFKVKLPKATDLQSANVENHNMHDELSIKK